MSSNRNILLDAFYSLGRNINKVRGDAAAQDTKEGVIGEKLPELKLDMDDQDLVELSDTWQKVWDDSDVKAKWLQRCEENENYWRGQQFARPDVDKTRPMVDNVIFESLETYLPQVTRRNPDAMVSLPVGVEQTPANQEFAHALQLELGELADELKIRLKLKGVARNKELYLIGAAKIGWNLDKDIPSVKVIRPQRLILDPGSVVDEDGYSGERIGEHRRLPAWKIIALTAGQDEAGATKKYIEELVGGDLGTELGFIEWWTDQYMFWKMGSKILAKRKNPHWNYDEEKPEEPEQPTVPEAPTEAPEAPAPSEQAIPAPISSTPENGPEGLPAGAPPVPQLPEEMQAAPAAPRKGVNHFKTPRMPYVLLATYNLGKQPMDDTSLIGQNLANQDIINKRNKQIDHNADDMNNGMVVSLERAGLTKEQAKGVTATLRKRGVVAIPSGNPQEAIWKPPTPGLPVDVYNDLRDRRNRTYDIFGTRGSSSAGISTEKTVRGKILNQQADTSRIGGGISEYLEQFADDVNNHLVQMLYVYDDRFQQAMMMGAPIPPVKVSIKEGSLLPKDATSIANQAMTLATEGKMALIDLYKRLDEPNPEELAVNAWLEVNAPEVLYEKDPRVAKVVQMKQQAAQEQAQALAQAKGGKSGPSESIAFKDLPPEGKAQMAEQAGITLHPEGIAAHDAFKEAQKAPPAPVPVGPTPAGP